MRIGSSEIDLHVNFDDQFNGQPSSQVHISSQAKVTPMKTKPRKKVYNYQKFSIFEIYRLRALGASKRSDQEVPQATPSSAWSNQLFPFEEIMPTSKSKKVLPNQRNVEKGQRPGEALF